MTDIQATKPHLSREHLLALLRADDLDKRDRQVLSEAGFPVSGEDVAH